MTERIGKYLSVEQVDPMSGRRTNRWLVRSNNDIVLGQIIWWSGWRQYVFEPVPQSIYNDACLADLRAFLQRANAEHRKRGEAPTVKP